ncbi:MAG: hypothetical protein AAFZ01_00615 [Pseudomonadota bacterium]
MADRFETQLSGGHPNSLGRTAEVVQCVLRDPSRFPELFDCYGSDDPVVRLRTSNAMKRVQAERPDFILPFTDRLINEVGALDQASAQWTLAQLFDAMWDEMTPRQRTAALKLMKRNIAEHTDWIVLKTTTQSLAAIATLDAALRNWLRPHLDRLTGDARKSVARTAAVERERLQAVKDD